MSRQLHPHHSELNEFSRKLDYHQEGGNFVSELYVDRLPNAISNPVEQLQYRLENSVRASTYLFSGLRGSGKTTELSRLKQQLNESNTSRIALFADMAEYLDLKDSSIGTADLLMAVLAGLGDAVKQHPKLGINVLKESIWDKTKALLNTPVDLRPRLSFGADASGAKLEIEATLRDNPQFVQKLREFSHKSTAFFDEAQRFASDVVQRIGEALGNPQINVILIVDSLERLSPPAGEEKQLFDSLKAIFDTEAKRLRFSTLSVVYSVPPYLQAVLKNVGASFDGVIQLPNFKVQQSKGLSRENQGLQQIREVLDKRYARWQELLGVEVVDHLAYMSGGNLRFLFRLLRDLIVGIGITKTPLPLTNPDAEVVTYVLNELSYSYQFLTRADRDCLKAIADTSSCEPEKDDDYATLIRLFDQSLVLDYVNGRRWYQVIPLVRHYLQDTQSATT